MEVGLDGDGLQSGERVDLFLLGLAGLVDKVQGVRLLKSRDASVHSDVGGEQVVQPESVGVVEIGVIVGGIQIAVVVRVEVDFADAGLRERQVAVGSEVQLGQRELRLLLAQTVEVDALEGALLQTCSLVLLLRVCAESLIAKVEGVGRLSEELVLAL